MHKSSCPLATHQEYSSRIVVIRNDEIPSGRYDRVRYGSCFVQLTAKIRFNICLAQRVALRF